MMKTTCFLVILFVVGITNGAELRVSSKEPVGLIAPDQWTATKDRTPNATFPFETYRIEPPTNRNAVCLISIYDKDKPEFADPEFLKKILRLDCRPYVDSSSELSQVEVKELKLDSGPAFYANFVDPDLVGKPIVPGSYKTATPIIASISSKYLIKITVLCDQIDGPDYRDVIAIVKSIKVKKQ